MPLHTKTATKAAINAGHAILSIYNDEKRDLQTEAKADDSPLTIADRKAHEIIMRELEATGLPVLSEEGIHLPYAERKEWTRFWLVDPLDGTREFISRNGEFTVNIALIEHNKPVMGVIYVPVTGILYLGVVGEGAWKGGGDSEDGGAFGSSKELKGLRSLRGYWVKGLKWLRGLRGSEKTGEAEGSRGLQDSREAEGLEWAEGLEGLVHLKQVARLKEKEGSRGLDDLIKKSASEAETRGARAEGGAQQPGSRPDDGALVVVGSRSHMSNKTQEYIEALKASYGAVEFVSVGSSLKFCLMAEGKADIYPRLGPTMEWDTAAGQAIAEAAGKQVLCIDKGKPLHYNKENLRNPHFVVK